MRKSFLKMRQKRKKGLVICERLNIINKTE
ncbi:MAG: hypothetical protein BWY31_02557 [Lentisphaerae bacterium ADurb.Bin242]|nr:MAG: hypothetical protein BWY31_02557 [Lentisphaerae bacterium ADurb.Bin242]